jgi:glycosyltransferase involved in cell wall biosynthesis
LSKAGALRVVHVAEDVSALAGGVPAVVRQLSERLARRGIAVQIAHATGDPGELSAGVEVFTFPPMGLGRAWSWGDNLRAGLARLAAPVNGIRTIFHIHGVWAAPQYFAARVAHAAGTPFVVTAHGMLDPWLWDEQTWKKRLKKRGYWGTVGAPALRKASAVHAITPLEREYLSRLFPRQRIEIIPNAIDVGAADRHPKIDRRKTILFLGRIEPKKGVDVLLRAFAQANIDEEWSVDVVGPVWSQAYSAHLMALVDQFGLAQRVRFHGPLFGDEKTRLIDTAWVMATPSHSEAIGLVNLEAAERHLPAITTHQTGLHDWESGGGMLIEPNAESLRKALEASCSWSSQEQRNRGESSRLLVKQRYSWQAVLPMWMELYASL